MLSSVDKGKLIDQAQKYASKGQIDKAVAEYQRVIEADPRDSRTRLKIGELHLKKGNKAAAIAEYSKAAEFYSIESFNLQAIAVYKQLLKIDPSIPEVYVKLADLYKKQGLLADALAQYRIVINNYEKEGKVKEAVDALKQMASMDPDNFSIRAKFADLSLKSGNRKEALEEYSKIAEDLKKKGRIDDVIILYEKLLSADESCLDAHRELGDAYLRLGKTEEALSSLQAAIKLAPDDMRVLSLMAEAYAGLDDLQSAKLTYETMLKVDPSSDDAGKGISRVLIKEGNYEEAIKVVLPVVDKALDNNNYDSALAVLLEFYRNDILEPAILTRMANIYRLKGETDKEIEVTTELNRIYEARGGTSKAEEKIEKTEPEIIEEAYEAPVIELPLDEHFIQPEELAVEAPGEDVSKYITEAEVYEKYGLKDKAIESLEAALRLVPGHEEALRMLNSLQGEHPEEVMPEPEEILLEAELPEEAEIEEIPELEEEVPELELEIEEEIVEEVTPEEAPVEAFIPPAEEEYPLSKVREELEEADFYIQQGLYDEARGVCNRILELYPENEDVLLKLKEIDEALQAQTQVQEPVAEEPGGEGLFDLAAELEGEDFEMLTTPSGMREAEKFGFEDIFSEFKKGVDSQLEKEDSETHYNLGIAYKEMGLLDDAIREFKIAAADPAREFDSYNLVGICFVEKGAPQKAVEVFKKGLELPNRSKDEYAGMSYELGLAYEQCGMIVEALAAYTEARNNVPNFRDAEGKIASLGGGREVKKGRVAYI